MRGTWWKAHTHWPDVIGTDTLNRSRSREAINFGNWRYLSAHVYPCLQLKYFKLLFSVRRHLFSLRRDKSEKYQVDFHGPIGNENVHPFFVPWQKCVNDINVEITNVGDCKRRTAIYSTHIHYTQSFSFPCLDFIMEEDRRCLIK